MSRRRHTPEQVVRKLRDADRLLSEGSVLSEVSEHLEVAEATYRRSRNQVGGMKVDDVKRGIGEPAAPAPGSAEDWAAQ